MSIASTLGLVALCSLMSFQEGKTMNTNKEVVSELYELLNTRQLDQLDRIVDSNCEGPNGEKGAEGFEHTVAPIIAAFPDIHWTLEDLIAEGDRVVVRWEWVGTFKAAFRGVPPTGKRMTNHAIGIYQLRDGKILRSWLETDRLGFLQQLGVVPENVSPGVAPKPAPVQN